MRWSASQKHFLEISAKANLQVTPEPKSATGTGTPRQGIGLIRNTAVNPSPSMPALLLGVTFVGAGPAREPLDRGQGPLLRTTTAFIRLIHRKGSKITAPHVTWGCRQYHQLAGRPFPFLRASPSQRRWTRTIADRRCPAYPLHSTRRHSALSL